MSKLTELIDILHGSGCSCVICNQGKIFEYHGRGVADLYRLLKENPERLAGALVADKVIGRGAAALMVLGGAKAVYADVMSKPALAILQGRISEVSAGQLVDNIINRSGTGICPVEALTASCKTAEECLPLIESFIESR